MPKKGGIPRMDAGGNMAQNGRPYLQEIAGPSRVAETHRHAARANFKAQQKNLSNWSSNNAKLQQWSCALL